MRAPIEICIVGAGVAGLAAATALARAGHRVALYERFANVRPVGSGLLLQPTGLFALQRLGLRHEVEALGARIARLHGVTKAGTTVFDLAYASLDPGLYAIGIHRAVLHGVLWGAFRRSGAALETGRTIVGVEFLSDDRIALCDAAGGRSAAFQLVIDASGARSPLRAAVTARAAKPFGYGAVWASVPDAGIAPGTLAQRYAAARIMAGYLPVGRTSSSGPPLAALFWSLKPENHPAWRADFPAWREELALLWPDLAQTITPLGPDDFSLASYAQFTPGALFRGPLVLIGDAAHATSPQLGQGANNALLDALVLADALDMSADIGSAFTAYVQARRGHVRFYQWASAAITPLFQSDSSALAALRDLTFNPLKRVPYLHREMLRTLAGLKSGLLSSAAPETLAGLPADAPPRTTPAPQQGRRA